MEVKRLKRQRTLLKCATAKLVNKIEHSLINEIDVGNLEILTWQLNDKFDRLNEIDSEILNHVSLDEVENEVECSESLQENLIAYRCKLSKRIKDLNVGHSSNLVGVSASSSRNMQLPNSGSCTIKLPELTSENYDNCIKSLKDRYSRNDVIVNCFMNDGKNFHPQRFDHMKTQVEALLTDTISAAQIKALGEHVHKSQRGLEIADPQDGENWKHVEMLAETDSFGDIVPSERVKIDKNLCPMIAGVDHSEIKVDCAQNVVVKETVVLNDCEAFEELASMAINCENDQNSDSETDLINHECESQFNYGEDKLEDACRLSLDAVNNFREAGKNLSKIKSNSNEVNDLCAKKFLLAFRRFVSRRGNCRIIYSDNAKPFESANKDVKYFLKIVRDPEVQDFTSAEGITVKFIVDRVPWWGGFYELLMRSTKEPFKEIPEGTAKSKILWDLGLITKVLLGRDELVRSYVVKTKRGQFKGPI